MDRYQILWHSRQLLQIPIGYLVKYNDMVMIEAENENLRRDNNKLKLQLEEASKEIDLLRSRA